MNFSRKTASSPNERQRLGAAPGGAPRRARAGVAHDAHPLAAAAGRGLEDHRIADPRGGALARRGDVGERAVASPAPPARRPRSSARAAVDLRAHRRDRLGRRADEDDSRARGRARELGALGEKPVARVDRVGADLDREIDQRVGLEIALARRRRTDPVRLVGERVRRATRGRRRSRRPRRGSPPRAARAGCAPRSRRGWRSGLCGSASRAGMLAEGRAADPGRLRSRRAAGQPAGAKSQRERRDQCEHAPDPERGAIDAKDRPPGAGRKLDREAGHLGRNGARRPAVDLDPPDRRGRRGAGRARRRAAPRARLRPLPGRHGRGALRRRTARRSPPRRSLESRLRSADRSRPR